MSEATPAHSAWKIVLAAILDFLTVFFVGGWIIGRATGSLTPDGFSLSGRPALLLFAVIIVYFVAAKRLGGRSGGAFFGSRQKPPRVARASPQFFRVATNSAIARNTSPASPGRSCRPPPSLR